MPSQTAGGLPYPLPTEPVRDGAVAIKALADALQLRGYGMFAQYGRIDPNVSGGNLTLTFPVAFTAPPSLFLCQADALSASQTLRVQVNNSGGGVQTTLAQLYVTNYDNNPHNGLCVIRWFAIGPR